METQISNFLNGSYKLPKSSNFYKLEWFTDFGYLNSFLPKIKEKKNCRLQSLQSFFIKKNLNSSKKTLDIWAKTSYNNNVMNFSNRNIVL